MLKALITFGGRGVTKLQLMDILWPETEGDAAHSAFTTTLSRLRHILGTEKAIKFQDGKATLDVCHCWVDAWAFERILGQVDAVWEEDLTGDGLIQAIHLAEKATKMYTGSFLAGETDPWTISFRERLRNKFLRNIVRLGYHWEKVGELNKAVNYYQRGLEVDDLAEEFYQRLMGCYQRMGRCAEAMAVYNRCQKVLSSVLGIQPSPKTKALYESLCKS
jgi:two-component SAPR family response regulator